MGLVDVSLIQWRKSTRSGTNSDCVEVGFVWRKSTRSESNANCVEVARAPQLATSGTSQLTAVRDSKHPDGPVLTFPVPAFTAALRAL